MTRMEGVARLQAAPQGDVCILCIREADYGCEESAEGTPERLWILLVGQDGAERSAEVAAGYIDGSGLTEGSVCCWGDLGLSASTERI